MSFLVVAPIVLQVNAVTPLICFRFFLVRSNGEARLPESLDAS